MRSQIVRIFTIFMIMYNMNKPTVCCTLPTITVMVLDERKLEIKVLTDGIQY